MGAKLWHFEGRDLALSGIFNKIPFTGPFNFCSFANPGKGLPVIKRCLPFPEI
jgi:hypothetical protein